MLSASIAESWPSGRPVGSRSMTPACFSRATTSIDRGPADLLETAVTPGGDHRTAQGRSFDLGQGGIFEQNLDLMDAIAADFSCGVPSCSYRKRMSAKVLRSASRRSMKPVIIPPARQACHRPQCVNVSIAAHIAGPQTFTFKHASAMIVKIFVFVWVLV